MHWDEDVDALGLLCPLPVLRVRKRLSETPAGTVVRLRASDPAAWIDVPHFCAEGGHVLLSAIQADGVSTFLIRRST